MKIVIINFEKNIIAQKKVSIFNIDTFFMI